MTIANARAELKNAISLLAEIQDSRAVIVFAYIDTAINELDDTHAPSVSHEQMTRLLKEVRESADRAELALWPPKK